MNNNPPQFTLLTVFPLSLKLSPFFQTFRSNLWNQPWFLSLFHTLHLIYQNSCWLYLQMIYIRPLILTNSIDHPGLSQHYFSMASRLLSLLPPLPPPWPILNTSQNNYLKFVRVFSPCAKPSNALPLFIQRKCRLPTMASWVLHAAQHYLFSYLCPLLTLLPPYWPMSHTHQGYSSLKVFSLAVLPGMFFPMISAWLTPPLQVFAQMSSSQRRPSWPP